MASLPVIHPDVEKEDEEAVEVGVGEEGLRVQQG